MHFYVLSSCETQADIFVLIIGRRYGFITDNGKSVTNLEYLRAKEKNIPIYAFIDKEIINNFYRWKKDKTADFSSIVDNNEIFNFVEEIREIDGTWTQEYESSSQIIDILKRQMAYLFNDSLMYRKNIIQTNIPQKVLDESTPTALSLVLEKPTGWEYKFFFQTLKDKLEEHQNLKRDFEYKVFLGNTISLSNTAEVIDWVMKKFNHFEKLINAMRSLINEATQKAFAESGVPSDLEFLIYISDRFSKIYMEIINWKIELESVSAPAETRKLLKELQIISDSVVEDIEGFIDDTIITLNELPEIMPEGETKELNLTLYLKEFKTESLEEEIDRLKSFLLDEK